MNKHNCTNPKTGKLCPGYQRKSKPICLIQRNPGEVKKPWFCQGVKDHRDGQ